ncbi:MAG: B12-binding domain-containing radical SAM protein [Nanoarchaeota archaeon]|nr:B12-binding domain-containing radical SAM protein [Nanoarchaeota archaeon]MBU1135683.1 B12-binding domain-containing radical SAM protein [Nanoarchaeota archaeon]MBU2520557.1 B12-binding domain-containing radical SAM protein [Nanoarchaeota archaeon]
MKISLVNPSQIGSKDVYIKDKGANVRSKADYAWPPIDLMMVGGALKKTKHQFKIFDFNAWQTDINGMKKQIKDYSPDMLLLLTSTPTFYNDTDIAKIFKNILADVKIGLIGTHASAIPEDILKDYKEIDFIIRGDSWESIIDVIDFFEGKIKDIPNTYYRNGNKIEKGSDIKRKSLEIYPAHDAVDLRHYHVPYARFYPLTATLTSIGCPYSCVFCTTKMFPFRMRSVENLMEELKHLCFEMNMKEIIFWDDTFTLFRDRAIKICDEMIKNRMNISWACSSRVDKIDKELLKKMKEAGCHTVLLGVEFGNQRILDESKKNTTISQMKKVFKETKEVGIETLAHCVLGYPGETKETMDETIKLVIELDPDFASFNICTPFPGTDLYEICKKNGWIITHDFSKYEPTLYPVFETPWLPRNVVWSTFHNSYRKFYIRPRYFFKRIKTWKSLRNVWEDIKNGIGLFKNL